jgi:hypothetical protein
VSVLRRMLIGDKQSTVSWVAKPSIQRRPGLMQMTKGAVDMVNKCTPKGIHFEHEDMAGAAKNIQCGTMYLDIAKNRMGGVNKSFGTGQGYSKSIVACEICLKGDSEHPRAALHKIHK